MPVIWLNNHPEICHPQEHWDTAFLQEMNIESDVPVVIIPGRFHVDDTAWINKQLKNYESCVVMIVSDEERLFPWQKLKHPNMKLWIMTPRATETYPNGTRFIGEGYAPGTRQLLKRFGFDVKTLDWFFAGQMTHKSRHECVDTLISLLETTRGLVYPTESFAAGVSQREYLAGLHSAKLAPCPSGPATTDSFRFYEALEAGCLPIVEARSPQDTEDGYWQMFHGKPPFPILNNWAELPELMPRLLSRYPRNANRASAWWQLEKRNIAHRLRMDTGIPNDGITVLIPTSVIPSHPDTSIIEETLTSVREQLPDNDILIMCDGLREEQFDRRADYDEYVRKICWKANHDWHNVYPIVFPRFLHQANITRAALKLVHTPLVLFVEHDTPLIGEIPWSELSGIITGGMANMIRLHHEVSVLAPHEHLMVDREPEHVGGVPMRRTVQWSQRPHLASARYYRTLLKTHFPRSSRTMIEDKLHSVIQSAWMDNGLPGWEEHKIWLYTPEGNIQRSIHTDGRAGEPKYEMRFK